MADAGRVIAGTARGTKLEAPGPGTRPLADRVKQTLFAILEPELRGAHFLDLFAGSGAAGIEALSRGATIATFVEQDHGAIRVIKANLAKVGLAERGTVVRAEVVAWIRTTVPTKRAAAAASPTWTHAFVDPPYADVALLGRVLETIGPLIVPGGRVVAKHFWRDTPPATTGLLASERERRFGETTLTFYRRLEDG